MNELSLYLLFDVYSSPFALDAAETMAVPDRSLRSILSMTLVVRPGILSMVLSPERGIENYAV